MGISATVRVCRTGPVLSRRSQSLALLDILTQHSSIKTGIKPEKKSPSVFTNIHTRNYSGIAELMP